MNGGKIDFGRWPKGDALAADGRAVPYLDLAGEDEPIEFLLSFGESKLLARANLHTLQGTKKAGKSAAGLAFIVALLKGEFIGLKAVHPGTRVLWIDTEQDKATLRQKGKAVLSMAGLDTQPESLKIVALRGYGTPPDLLASTLQAIEENTAEFVFLDGVVDLCESFNDEEKSRAVVHELEAYAERYGAAILCLIHTNKYNEEARGHLGAIMQQKSAEIYQVAKDGNTAKVSQPCSRFAPVPDFGFSFADKFKIEPPEEGNTDLERWSALNRAFSPLLKDRDERTATEVAGA